MGRGEGRGRGKEGKRRRVCMHALRCGVVWCADRVHSGQDRTGRVISYRYIYLSIYSPSVTFPRRSM
jgi:hypothetical protein